MYILLLFCTRAARGAGLSSGPVIHFMSDACVCAMTTLLGLWLLSSLEVRTGGQGRVYALPHLWPMSLYSFARILP